MALTKIINVQKSDSFGDVFDFFREAQAEEIIFIFPKGSKFAKQDGYLQLIKEEADRRGIVISVMTSDPAIIKQTSLFGVQLLSAKVSTRSRTYQADDTSGDWQPISSNNDDKNRSNREDDRTQPGLEEEFEEPEPAAMPADIGKEDDLPMATLAVSPRKAGKSMRDIVRPGADKNLKIKTEPEDIFDIDIKHHVKDHHPEKDIAKVWERSDREEDHDIAYLGKKSAEKFKIGGKKKWVWTGVVVVVVVLIPILYGALAKAKVVIQLQKQNLNFQLKISASSSAPSVDIQFNRIPGQLFNFQKEDSGSFPVTGDKNLVQKSSGKITIYNKSSAAKSLVATTRFESTDKLIFRIPQTLTVPPATKNGDQLVPGSVGSIVFADKPGAEYNIGPTQFTIPGFKDGPKYNYFYAVSKEPMSGGQIGEAKVVTDADFSKARETLTNQLKDEIIKSLKTQSGQLKILDSAAVKFDDPITNAKISDPADELKMTIRGSAQTVGFKESDVRELIDKFVQANSGMDVLDKDLAIQYREPVIDNVNKTMKFTVQVNGTAAAKIDLVKVKNDILGLDEEAIRSYFKDLKEVESARVSLSPFLVKRIPSDQKKVKIEVKY